MGLSATESSNRILESFACGEKYDLNDEENIQSIMERMIAIIEDNFADVK